MPNRLKQKSLGDFLTLQRGHDLTDSQRCVGNVPVFGAAGHNGFHNKAKTRGPGVVIGRSGSGFGNVHLCETDFWPHNTGLYVTDFKGNDPYFAYYFLKNLDFKQYNSGSAQPSLNRNYLYPIKILVPEPADQQKIAKVLSTLDAKIELNNRINAELEAMAKLLYDYWFVQFDFPMTAAQATALGQPQLEGQPYKTSGGKMVFNETLKREIPEGWEAGGIDRFATLNEKVWTDKTAPSSLIYIDLANTKNGQILEKQKYDWKDAPSRARRILRAGDTIVGTVRPGNRSFSMVPKSDTQLTGSTGFAVLTPINDHYREFNYLSLTSETNITRLTTVASGAAYPAVNPEVVATGKTTLPTEDLINQFHSVTSKQFDLIQNNQKQNQELSELRDWLLPLLMNGQVTIKQ